MRRAGISILLNALLALFAFGAVLSYFLPPFGMPERGLHALRYFTTDSNLLAGIAALVLLPAQVRALRTSRPVHWGFPLGLKFVASTAVGVTFFTVLLFLGPLFGFDAVYKDVSFVLHAVCPLLAMGSFLLVDGGPRLPLPRTLWGVLPTLVYGVIYFVMVVILGPGKGGWEDFYAFNMGGLWPIAAIGMPAATWGIALLLGRLRPKETT